MTKYFFFAFTERVIVNHGSVARHHKKSLLNGVLELISRMKDYSYLNEKQCFFYLTMYMFIVYN
jgi:hypothetical protein